MSTSRETLKPHVNKRVTVRGTFSKFDPTWKTGYRYTGKACILYPEIDGEVVCDHVWVVDAPHWKQYQGEIGSQVTFDAVVQSYFDKGCNATNYRLGNASEPIILHQSDVDAVLDSEVKEPSSTELIVVKSTDSAVSEQADLTLQKLRQAKNFASLWGGVTKAEEIVQSLPPMPIEELLEYLKLLRD